MEDLGKILLNRINEIRVDKNRNLDISDLDGLMNSMVDTIKRSVLSETDIKIFKEITKISDKIRTAKVEVAHLNPVNIGKDFIPGATSELSEVTKATEKSTNIILDASEAIQNLTSKVDNKEVAQAINNKVIEIFEACNFQDVTGQRITKVVKILEEIDATITSLINAFTTSHEKKEEKFDEKNLLNGPQASDVAPSQSQIDDLFNGS